MTTLQDEIKIGKSGKCPKCAEETGIPGIVIPNGSNHCFICLDCGATYGSCKD